ncbi:hypothetical protein C8J56DRAFT_932735 [Mycena floridula]|nr:hypothetical protein C8J56DRAFT_932735 [Mycena floridula]
MWKLQEIMLLAGHKSLSLCFAQPWKPRCPRLTGLDAHKGRFEHASSLVAIRALRMRGRGRKENEPGGRVQKAISAR